MKLKQLAYLLLALPFLWSCNTEDDINEIFISGTWNVVNYFGKANWEKRNGDPVYKMYEKEGEQALRVISTFTLTFSEDGTFAGTMQNASFNGRWTADGKDRSIRLSFNGTPNTSTYFNREFIGYLKDAAFYQGDSNVLMLAPQEKKSYIQLRHR